MKNLAFIIFIPTILTGCDPLRVILSEKNNIVSSDCIGFNIFFTEGISPGNYSVTLKFDSGELVYPKNFSIIIDDSLITDFNISLLDTPFDNESININDLRNTFNEEVTINYRFKAKSYDEANLLSLRFDNYAKCDNQYVPMDPISISK